MKIYSILTPTCESNAQSHGVLESVRRIAKKIEHDQSIGSWDLFLPTPYIKKSLGRDWRVIAERRYLDDRDIMVVSLIAVLSRGSHDYEQFMAAPDQFGHPLLPTQDQVISKLEAETHLVTDELPPPSDAEYQYLYGISGASDGGERLVFESKEWVDEISRTSELGWCYELLVEAMGSASEDVQCLYKHDMGIMFKHFHQNGALFLVGILARRSPDVEDDLLTKYSAVLKSPSIGQDELLKISRRSYPSLIVADAAIWRTIQKNTEANLALSPEESAILDSITHSDTNRRFPLFINGRPGSGKSTILQYLFTEYLYLYLTLEDPPASSWPIYLTYSENLIQWAKKTIKSLITCSAGRMADATTAEANSINAKFDSVSQHCFAEFHKFLLQLLPEKECTHFASDKRIDFPRFRTLWHKRLTTDPDNEIRRLSPEIAWHVIRTYIKGMRDDENLYLTPEGYLELPSKQRSIEKTTFDLVYGKIWEAWYKKLGDEDRYWDNQDLARAVLNLSSDALSRSPAVFCDEAQDFTKIELELILKLSVFSRRKLQFQDLRRVPFAFAGDPFQTLNPTGFDWGSVQAGFHEKIIQELDRTARGNLEFNYQELHFNYRSSHHIVGFCNLIQLLRGILFDVKGLKPQKTWFDHGSHLPAYFSVGDEQARKHIFNQAELVILLPCQEGEEKDYVKADEFLSTLVSDTEARNFLSPMAAKGLEFSRIVLYKFGEEFRQRYPGLFSPFDTNVSLSDNPEAALPYEYFMNRLYVAASRPKRRLFIVDTDQGIESFWRHEILRDHDGLVTRYAASSAGVWSADDLSLIQPGSDQSWSDDRDDPMMLAQQFLEEGYNTRDPYKLMLASANFHRANDPEKAKWCLAARYEIEGNYREAGNIFSELADWIPALRCFWRERAYDRILEVKQFENNPEHMVASFFLSEQSLAGCLKLVEQLVELVEGPSRNKVIADEQWGDVLDNLLYATREFIREETNWKRVYHQVVSLTSAGLDLSANEVLAEIAYRAELFEEAISWWDLSGRSDENDNYALAKIQSQKFPDNVLWLAKLKRFGEIVRAYDESESKQLPEALQESVFEAFVRLEDRAGALRFLFHNPSSERLRNIVEGENEGPLTRARLERLVPLVNDIQTLRVIGRAADRLDRIIDTLSFYETFFKRGPYSIDVRDSARRSWIEAKNKQADLSEKRGKAGDAIRFRKEAEKAALRWNLGKTESSSQPSAKRKISENATLSDDKRRAIDVLRGQSWTAESIAEALSLRQDQVVSYITELTKESI